ncbi:MAG: hypothetical protein O2985_03230 [Proteobacteria bacterium]|nr:hypothetical protein [Pseudomonadota bacterium]
MDVARSGPNPFPPDRMTTAERLGELASILAAGLIRLRARQSSKQSADRGDSCLDFPGHRSGHEPVDNPTETLS